VSADREALLATVRRAIRGQSHWSEGFAALDSLAAELERLQNKLNTDSQNFELEARKAELERVKAERDIRTEHRDMLQGKLDKALAALREIAERRVPPTYGGGLGATVNRARAAIAEIEGEA